MGTPHVGGALQQQRLGALCLLHAAGAGVGEVAVALLVLRRETRRRLGRGDLRGGLVDQGLLQLKLGRQVGDLVAGCLAVGQRLVQRGLQVPIIDPRQDLPSLDRLVVVHQHLGDVAGDTRGDDDRIRLHVGIVGLHLEPADLPVAQAECRRGDEAKHPSQGGERALYNQIPAAVAADIGDDYPVNDPAHDVLSSTGQHGCPFARLDRYGRRSE